MKKVPHYISGGGGEHDRLEGSTKLIVACISYKHAVATAVLYGVITVTYYSTGLLVYVLTLHTIFVLKLFACLLVE